MSYTNFDQLWEYLKVTHPPQQPGRLKDDEYQALAAYLWAANGKDMPTETSMNTLTEAQLGPEANQSTEAGERVLAEEQLEPVDNQPMVLRVGIIFFALVVIFLWIFFLQRKKSQ